MVVQCPVGFCPTIPGSGVYSVKQSEGNSFGGDIVLESVNMASRDEDSILNQTHIRTKYFQIFIMKILNVKSD